ncbi:MAG: hypothetical protein Q8T03_13320 [Bacteroidota bacterium]|nr:hypothetical protein [Bacteroidota bacterium]MDP3558346.1 hypothetical protein [Bacteroidota bacterium]
MATEIINNGSSLKIVTDNAPRFILKNQIKEVEVVRDTIIKIDIGQGALYNVFVDQAEVTTPVSATVEELRDKIMEMLQSAEHSGLATEIKQTEGNAEIVNLKNSMNEMKDKVNALNDKLFYEPKLVDESNANLVFKGFAVPGAKTDEPVWAVLKVTNTKGVLSYQWADGNKNFDNVWDNRKVLVYS